MSPLSAWLHAIVSDLQGLADALPRARSPEVLDLLLRFGYRLPRPANPLQDCLLDSVLRRCLMGMAEHVVLGLPPHVRPPVSVYDGERAGTARERFVRCLERLVEAVEASVCEAERPMVPSDAAARSVPVAAADRPRGEVCEAAREHWRVMKFHAIIQQRWRDPTLQALGVAEELGITRTWLSKLLRKHTGHGFAWHVDAYRMPEAERLLRETALLVEEVAGRVGYTVAQLEARFKDCHGITPTDFRMRALAAELSRDDPIEPAS